MGKRMKTSKARKSSMSNGLNKSSSKPKSRSKMTRGKKSTSMKNVANGKVSKQEKKFHRKVKFNVPLKKNPLVHRHKNQSSNDRTQSTITRVIDDNDDDDDMILPLDMLSDDDGNEQVVDDTMITDDEDDDHQQMESYERQPRSNFSKLDEHRPLLPIKTDRGQLIPQSTPVPDMETDDDDDDEEDVAEEQPTSPPPKPTSVVELMAERESKLAEMKQTIVTLCDTIMKNPYDEISHLKQLRLLLNLGDPLISVTVRKLTMLSLVELFRDIIPGYRIRSLKETIKDDNEELKIPKHKQKTTNRHTRETLSKDVKVIRHFEQTLLKHYQQFLHFLEQCAKKSLIGNHLSKRQKKTTPVSSSKLGLGRLAVQCLCKLLTNLHHFNFRTNLLSVIVDFMANNDTQVQELCCNCVSDLLRHDRTGELSLETVRFITRMLKTSSYAVAPCVLDVFLALNIREISPIEEKKLEKSTRVDYRAQKLSRRDRHRHKETQELKKTLEDKTMANRQQQRLKINRQIIELLFLNYFRLLKRRLNFRLMPSVCEGLAKFANLINIEYMDDLISCFHDELTAEQSGLSQRAKFHCLITVFSILNRQFVLVHIDPQRFYALFYGLLVPVPSDDDIDLVIQLVQLMLLDRYKQLSRNKLLAFTKRLLTMCVHLQYSKSIAAILEMVKALLSISPLITEQLYENELTGSGVNYLPELNDPEYCRAQNATLYELILLRTIGDNRTRQQCEDIIQGKFITDPHVLRSCQANALAHLQVYSNVKTDVSV